MKKIEDQGKKQIESLKEHEKKPVESNELVKKDFKIDSAPLDGQKKSIDSIETYAYGISKDLVSDKEEIKCNNTIE